MPQRTGGRSIAMMNSGNYSNYYYYIIKRRVEWWGHVIASGKWINYIILEADCIASVHQGSPSVGSTRDWFRSHSKPSNSEYVNWCNSEPSQWALRKMIIIIIQSTTELIGCIESCNPSSNVPLIDGISETDANNIWNSFWP